MDFIITRENDSPVVNCNVGPPFLDHHSVSCSLHTSKPPPVRKTAEYRKVSKLDFDGLNCDLTAVFKDIAHSAENYNKYVDEVFNKHANVISKTFLVKPLTPWIDDEILGEKREKRRLERK